MKFSTEELLMCPTLLTNWPNVIVLPIKKQYRALTYYGFMYYASSKLSEFVSNEDAHFYKWCSKSTPQVFKINSSFVTNYVQNNLALGIFINDVQNLETQKQFVG